MHALLMKMHQETNKSSLFWWIDTENKANTSGKVKIMALGEM